MNAASLTWSLVDMDICSINDEDSLTMLWRQLPDSPERTMWPPGSEMTRNKRTVFWITWKESIFFISLTMSSALHCSVPFCWKLCPFLRSLLRCCTPPALGGNIRVVRHHPGRCRTHTWRHSIQLQFILLVHYQFGLHRFWAKCKYLNISNRCFRDGP